MRETDRERERERERLVFIPLFPNDNKIPDDLLCAYSNHLPQQKICHKYSRTTFLWNGWFHGVSDSVLMLISFHIYHMGKVFQYHSF